MELASLERKVERERAFEKGNTILKNSNFHGNYLKERENKVY